MSRTFSRAAICAFCFFFAAMGVRLSAQTLFGRISGTITDPTGAVIAGANVTITNTDTQAVRTATTDAQGFYVVENLSIGPYTVGADKTGFKHTDKSGFQVVADGRATADLQLQLGETSETVEVVATATEVLNTVSGEVAHTIEKEQIENIPLNGRNYMELLTLVPGVTVTNPDTFSINTSLSATNQVVNGHRSNENNMTVDGVGNMDSGSNGSLINNISPDFMQEVKIQTSNFSAEYGRSTGASFNLVTKNGTDAYHGSAFETFRNDKLDARNFFSPNRTELRYNDFGYDVGGPIKKGKMFFFVGEEWKRLRQQNAPTRYSVPSTAELAGNFNGSGKTLDEPGTKTPFPNDTIPASMITPDGNAIANTYRTSIGLAALFTNTSAAATAGNNATFENPNPLNYREDLGRFDYTINDQHRFFLRWVDDYNTIYLANGPGGDMPVVPEDRKRPGKSFLMSETWILTPTIVNEVHLGASWNGQNYQNLGQTWTRSDEGFTFQRIFNSQGAWSNGIPQVSISNFGGWDSPSSTLYSPTTEIEGGDTVSIVKGQHSLRTGVLIIRNRKNQNGRSAYDGNVSFATTTPMTTGYALGDALLGNFATYTEATYDPIGYYRYTEPAAFVDDSWRLSKKLTLNLGFRYEYMMAMYSTINNLAEFVPSLYNPAQAVTVNSSGQVVPNSGNLYNGLQRVSNGVSPSNTYLVPNAQSTAVLSVPDGAPRGMYNGKSAWQPRVGFAYSWDSKTVIRGGFGLFYDRIQGNPTFYTLNNPPYVGSVSYNNGNLSNITGGSTVSAPWGTIQTIDKKLNVPYSEQFSLGVQRTLPYGLFAEANVIGTLGRHLLVEPDINQPSWATLAANKTGTNENSIRPYAGFSTIQMFLSNATSNYYAMQLKLTRRAGRFFFTTAYTYSKVLTDASSDTQNDEDAFNIKSMYGPATFDVRNVFVGTAVWHLWDLNGHSPFMRRPLGGWTLSAVVHLQSGFYYTPVANNASILSGSRLANYNGLPDSVPITTGNDRWTTSSSAGWNRAAFVAAPYDMWGNAGPGSLQGPGMEMYNLSLDKSFVVNERRGIALRLRADFINAFNHTNFESPSLNASDSTFGTVTTAYPPRNIQLGLRLIF
jgi:hypothetical protein